MYLNAFRQFQLAVLFAAVSVFGFSGAAFGQLNPDANIYYSPDDGNVSVELINSNVGAFSIISQGNLLNTGNLNESTTLGMAAQNDPDDIAFSAGIGMTFPVGLFDLGQLFAPNLIFTNAPDDSFSSVTDGIGTDLGVALLNFTVGGGSAATVAFTTTTTATAVPEPGVLPALLAGSTLLFWYGRRRKKSN